MTFSGTSGLSGAVLATLREFAEAPGRYAVRLREPALLFQSTREVLLIAAQRHDGIPAGLEVESAQAACVFIKTAFLREGADHYTLLGLDPNADDAAIKQHYRLMMRLIHPDFAAASSIAWPADAATRVNLAYNVLSSPVQRREYDGALTDGKTRVKGQPVAEPFRANGSATRDPKAAEKRTASARRRLRSVVALCGIAGVLLLIAVVLMFDRGSQADLVQRKSQAPLVAKRNGPSEALGGGDSALMAMPELTASAKEAALLAGNVRLGQPEISAPTALGKPSAPAVGPRSKASAPAPGEVVVDDSSRPVRTAGKNDAASADETDSKDAKAKPVLAIQRVASPPDPTVDAPVVLRAANRTDVSHVPVDAVKDKAVPPPGITIAEVQPIIAVLLQQLESGRGNNLIMVLDKDARRDPSSLAFASYYDGFVNGARSVRVSQVDLKPESGNGRLLVTGFVRVELGEGVQQVKRLALRAEFSSRAGAVAMTRLTGAESVDR